MAAAVPGTERDHTGEEEEFQVRDGEEDRYTEITEEDLTWKSPLSEPIRGRFQGGNSCHARKTQAFMQKTFKKLLVALHLFVTQDKFDGYLTIPGTITHIYQLVDNCRHFRLDMEYRALDHGLVTLNRICDDMTLEFTSPQKRDSLKLELKAVALSMIRNLLEQRDSNLYNYFNTGHMGPNKHLGPRQYRMNPQKRMVVSPQLYQPETPVPQQSETDILPHIAIQRRQYPSRRQQLPPHMQQLPQQLQQPIPPHISSLNVQAQPFQPRGSPSGSSLGTGNASRSNSNSRTY